jgi:hypothetical protein
VTSSTTVPAGAVPPTSPTIGTPTTGSAAPLTTTSSEGDVPGWLAGVAIVLVVLSATGAARVAVTTVERPVGPPARRRGRHLGGPE